MSAGSEPSRKPTPEEQRERDELLRRVLHTPPQPRPKREREKTVSPKGKKAKKTPAD